MHYLEKNYNTLKQIISSKLREIGRREDSVTIVVASKYASCEEIKFLAQVGHKIFGENRVQDAIRKSEELRKYNLDIEWHFIGHLQKNKARKAVKLFSKIHSIDSIDLMKKLEKCCEEEKKCIEGFIQVNVSGEETKFGISPKELNNLLEYSKNLKWLRINGLMTIAPYNENPEESRKYFRKLKELRNSAQKYWGKKLEYLSMGMSNDYLVALEEGANIVRIGSLIFKKS